MPRVVWISANRPNWFQRECLELLILGKVVQDENALAIDRHPSISLSTNIHEVLAYIAKFNMARVAVVGDVNEFFSHAIPPYLKFYLFHQSLNEQVRMTPVEVYEYNWGVVTHHILRNGDWATPIICDRGAVVGQPMSRLRQQKRFTRQYPDFPLVQ